MKKFIMIAIVLLASLAFPNMTKAAMPEGTLMLTNMPTSVTASQENFLVVQIQNTPRPLIFTYKGGPFPAKTETGIKEETVANDRVYTIEFKIPGGTWEKVTWSMLANEMKQVSGVTGMPSSEVSGPNLPDGTEVRIFMGQVQIRRPGEDWQDHAENSAMEVYRSPVYDPITHRVIAYDIFVYNRETGETTVLYSNVDTKWFTIRVLGVAGGTVAVLCMYFFWVL